MSIEKNINTRIQHKHDIEANWLKAVNFIPKQGEIIIYDIDNVYNYERIKIGDGITIVSNLPFLMSQNSQTETDPTVPAWAKAATKPNYTAEEVGALPNTTVIPTKVSQLTNDKNYLTAVPAEYVTETEMNAKGYLTEHQSLAGYATETYVNTQIQAYVDEAILGGAW